MTLDNQLMIFVLSCAALLALSGVAISQPTEFRYFVIFCNDQRFSHSTSHSSSCATAICSSASWDALCCSAGEFSSSLWYYTLRWSLINLITKSMISVQHPPVCRKKSSLEHPATRKLQVPPNPRQYLLFMPWIFSQIWQRLPERHSTKEGLQATQLRRHFREDNPTRESPARDHHKEIPCHPTVWPVSKISKQPGLSWNRQELRVNDGQLFPRPTERDPGEKPADALWERGT